MSNSREPRQYASSPCMLHEFEDGDAGQGHVTIYHNPACRKSRETLALIRQSGTEPRVIEYLKTPPSREALKAIVQRLNLRPEELVRKEETEFEAHYAGKTLDDEGWIKALAEHPKLLQRPIVVRGNRAVIGRPPSNVNALLDLKD